MNEETNQYLERLVSLNERILGALMAILSIIKTYSVPQKPSMDTTKPM